MSKKKGQVRPSLKQIKSRKHKDKCKSMWLHGAYSEYYGERYREEKASWQLFPSISSPKSATGFLAAINGTVHDQRRSDNNSEIQNKMRGKKLTGVPSIHQQPHAIIHQLW